MNDTRFRFIIFFYIHAMVIRQNYTLKPAWYHYRPQRSWANVIFSEACVKNSVHRGRGGCLPQCMLGYTPLGAGPPSGWDTPQEQTLPPGSRHPWKQTPPAIPGADSPAREQTPLWSRHPCKQTPPRSGYPLEQTPCRSRHPPGKQTAAYGQRAASMHPAGMHSCSNQVLSKIDYHINTSMTKTGTTNLQSKMSIIELSRLGQDLFDLSDLT